MTAEVDVSAVPPYTQARLPPGLWAILVLAAIAGIVAATFSVQAEQASTAASSTEVAANRALLKRIEELERIQAESVDAHRINNRNDHLCQMEFITRIIEDARAGTRAALGEPCPRALPGFNLDQVLEAIGEPAPRVPNPPGTPVPRPSG